MPWKSVGNPISIHALREEGDPSVMSRGQTWGAFLSTPSARRATLSIHSGFVHGFDFYPRPPRGGRLERLPKDPGQPGISIHALRGEGDFAAPSTAHWLNNFYPRPP